MKIREFVNTIVFVMMLFLSNGLMAQSQQSPTEPQESQTQPFDSRVRLNIDLSDQDLSDLKSNGRLRMSIPEHYENRVAAILIRHVDSYLHEKVRVNGEPRVVQNFSQVRMDDLMVERLRYQPIEYRVFEKNFRGVEIRYIEQPEAKVFVADNDQSLTREAYQIEIANRFNLNAKINKLEKVKLMTTFGTYDIPWSSIDRIQFGSSETNSAKLFLNDGSEVSGHVEMKTLDIKTRWGKITIPAHDLRSISR